MISINPFIDMRLGHIPVPWRIGSLQALVFTFPPATAWLGRTFLCCWSTTSPSYRRFCSAALQLSATPLYKRLFCVLRSFPTRRFQCHVLCASLSPGRWAMVKAKVFGGLSLIE